MTPRVSVIIPAYNSRHWLTGSIGHVLAQTFQDLEVIVVDDGSTDDSWEVVEQFNDERVRYLRQENRGVSSARNTGIRAARGDLIALLDADDLFHPEKLSRQVKYLDSHSHIGLVTCGFRLIDQREHSLGDQCFWLFHPRIDLELLLFWNPLLPSTLLIRKSWFEKAGLFDETLKRAEDWELPVRLALQGCEMDYVREVLVSYRRHPRNASTEASLVSVFTEGNLRFMRTLFEQGKLPPELQSLRNKVVGNLYLDAAARAYGAQMGEQGKEWLEMALRYDEQLLSGNPPSWVAGLCGHALGTLVSDLQEYLRTVTLNLPDQDSFREWDLSRLSAHLCASLAFKKFREGQRIQARIAAIRACWADPGLMRNRGLWAIALKP